MKRITALGIFALGLATARYFVRRRGSLDLAGKTVVITGGSRGLGLVLARELGKRGARLVLASRDTDILHRSVIELEQRGYEVSGVPCDVRHPDQVAHLMEVARNRFGSIDVLVNDAGVIEVGPLESMTIDDFRRSIETHFWGPLSTSLAVIPEMRARGEGRIVNIASIGGLLPVPHLVPYSASKAALVGLSSAMGTELARDGVMVTTVCPGLMITGSPRNASFKGRHREEYAWFSIGDALPFTSMSAKRAARRIARAIERGEPMVVFGLETRLAQLAYAIAPNFVSRMLSLVARLLPAPGGIGAETRLGYESVSAASPSLLTALGERAAARNAELT
jgi:NAD(P)-dependent dehydrogenase (short-subunit alcohol dehydrogenase family)